MARQQSCQCGPLGGRECEELAALPESGECAPTMLGPRGGADKLEPARAGALALERMQHRSIEGHRVVPAAPFLGVEIEAERDELERGEVPAREIAHRQLEDDGSDELGNPVR